jgi:hypothetical protein
MEKKGKKEGGQSTLITLSTNLEMSTQVSLSSRLLNRNGVQPCSHDDMNILEAVACKKVWLQRNSGGIICLILKSDIHVCIFCHQGNDVRWVPVTRAWHGPRLKMKELLPAMEGSCEQMNK